MSNVHTVDGSEIRRSPVEVGGVYPNAYRVFYISGGWPELVSSSINGNIRWDRPPP